jgi:uncharacterized protein (DUF169 family)
MDAWVSSPPSEDQMKRRPLRLPDETVVANPLAKREFNPDHFSIICEANSAMKTSDSWR